MILKVNYAHYVESLRKNKVNENFYTCSHICEFIVEGNKLVVVKTLMGDEYSGKKFLIKDLKSSSTKM